MCTPSGAPTRPVGTVLAEQVVHAWYIEQQERGVAAAFQGHRLYEATTEAGMQAGTLLTALWIVVSVMGLYYFLRRGVVYLAHESRPFLAGVTFGWGIFCLVSILTVVFALALGGWDQLVSVASGAAAFSGVAGLIMGGIATLGVASRGHHPALQQLDLVWRSVSDGLTSLLLLPIAYIPLTDRHVSFLWIGFVLLMTALVLLKGFQRVQPPKTNGALGVAGRLLTKRKWSGFLALWVGSTTMALIVSRLFIQPPQDIALAAVACIAAVGVVLWIATLVLPGSLPDPE